MTYLIVNSSTTQALQKRVQKLLDKGCTLHGAPFYQADPGMTKNTGFCQAVLFQGEFDQLTEPAE